MKRTLKWAWPVLLRLTEPVTAADLPEVMPVKAAPTPTAHDWSGFYLGGHLGYAWGTSNWTAGPIAAATPDISGSLDLFQAFDGFKETGSFLEGLQFGYNDMLPNRLVIGAEADASFPSFPNLDGISTGGTSMSISPSIGAASYSETVLSFGTVRPASVTLPGTGCFTRPGVSPGPRPIDADAGDQPDERITVFVAIWLGRRR